MLLVLLNSAVDLANFLLAPAKTLINVTLLGFHFGGVTGAIKSFFAVIRRRTPMHPKDGIQLTSDARVDGITFPSAPWLGESGWRRILQRISNFRCREDDVFVVSYPKCGHHFLHEVLNMLLTGETALHPHQKMSNFLEFYSDPDAHFGPMPSPRVILTHVPLKWLPKEICERKSRVIRISRNPKDVIVSYYHHNLAINYRFYSDSLENYVKLHLSEPCFADYGSFFKFELDYEQRINQLDHVIRLTFENLKKNPVTVIKKLGEFLGLNHHEDFYEKVARATDFANVAAAKGGNERFLKAGRSLYRSGAVGKWRDFLSVAQSEAIDVKIRNEWGGTSLECFFDYGN